MKQETESPEGTHCKGPGRISKHSNPAEVLWDNKLHVNNTLSVNNIWQTNVHLRAGNELWSCFLMRIQQPRWTHHLSNTSTHFPSSAAEFLGGGGVRSRKLVLLLVLLRANQDTFQIKSQKPISDVREDWEISSQKHFLAFFPFPYNTECTKKR